jgi:hypothetical protein
MDTLQEIMSLVGATSETRIAHHELVSVNVKTERCGRQTAGFGIERPGSSFSAESLMSLLVSQISYL